MSSVELKCIPNIKIVLILKDGLVWKSWDIRVENVIYPIVA